MPWGLPGRRMGAIQEALWWTKAAMTRRCRRAEAAAYFGVRFGAATGLPMVSMLASPLAAP